MLVLSILDTVNISVYRDQDRISKLKGSPISKACMKFTVPVQIKMAILSRRPILLAKLLYEQFIHLTRINLRPNIQFLSTQQNAYQSFLLLPGLIPFAPLWHAV